MPFDKWHSKEEQKLNITITEENLQQQKPMLELSIPKIIFGYAYVQLNKSNKEVPGNTAYLQ